MSSGRWLMSNSTRHARDCKVAEVRHQVAQPERRVNVLGVERGEDNVRHGLKLRTRELGDKGRSRIAERNCACGRGFVLRKSATNERLFLSQSSIECGQADAQELRRFLLVSAGLRKSAIDVGNLLVAA